MSSEESSTCIYTLQSYQVAEEEHILQANLGARWKSGLFCSPKINTEFSRIDASLSNRVKELRVLLGADGGYREAAALKKIPDLEGREFRMESGGQLTQTRPLIKIAKKAGSPDFGVHTEVHEESQIDWAAKEVVDQIHALEPTFRVTREEIAQAIREKGVKSRHIPSSPLHLQSVTGGLDPLRAIVKSAFNLLGVSAAETALLPCFDAVREFILNGIGPMETFIRFGKGTALENPKMGPADHFVAVWSEGSNVWAHCQLYGVLIHPMCLTSNYAGESFQFGYLVDPLREANPAESRTPTFLSSALPSFALSPVFPDSSIQESFSERLSKILAVSLDRMRNSEIERIIESNLLPHDGEPLTKELLEKVSRDLTEFIVESMTRTEPQQ